LATAKNCITTLELCTEKIGALILIVKQFKIRKMKFIKSIVLAFTVLIATTNIAYSQTTTTTQTTDSLKTATIKVKGITCSMDLKMISTNIEKIKGVRSCKTGKQGTTTTFEVKFKPELVKEKEIFAAIENTGSCYNPDVKPYKIKQ